MFFLFLPLSENGIKLRDMSLEQKQWIFNYARKFAGGNLIFYDILNDILCQVFVYIFWVHLKIKIVLNRIFKVSQDYKSSYKSRTSNYFASNFLLYEIKPSIYMFIILSVLLQYLYYNRQTYRGIKCTFLSWKLY